MNRTKVDNSNKEKRNNTVISCSTKIIVEDLIDSSNIALDI
jgi:hypothetical protein